jgi:hypothetical protein
MTRAQLRETYQNGWDVINHARSSAAYPATGTLFNYPDNPPGTTGIDYTYELEKNNTWVRDHIGISGVLLTHVILPAGDTSYMQPARGAGYKSVSAQ